MNAVVRMTVIVVALFLAMKVIVLIASGTRLRGLALVAFLTSFGMRPSLFTRRAPRDCGALTRRAAVNIGIGAALIALARRFESPILALAALSLILHFGVINLVAAFWRRLGFAADATFHAPLRAKSLSEFWGRRWNAGFSEMVALTVQRPLRERIGETGAIVTAFAVSGLLHELAISVPVRAGYGLPTLYFLLHGVLVAAEKRSGRVPGTLATLAWLALPAPLVFHPPFIRGVIWPLIGS
ncbi:MAG TPA: MBOAT family protein [Thermoanaerobaculia bacterium]|nr:MBOAT family protein [Thermoanaerobaculia bacterium]